MHLFYPQYGPRITPNNTAFVHHIIVYLCGALVDITDGTSSVCMGQASLAPISQCRQGTTIAGWAVGGEVYSNYSITNHFYKANTRSCYTCMAESKLVIRILCIKEFE